RELPRAHAFSGSVRERAALLRVLDGMDAVVSAAPYTANRAIAECAAESGVHYFDLTEDVRVAHFVKELADGARVAFAPQCGVAPGYVSIAAVHVLGQFDEVDSLTLRTGALPRQPNNRLKYNLTWSTEGLVNEYVLPCEALRDGELAVIPPLEGEERLLIDGVAYEAFTTSGGAGTLCHTYRGKIRRLDYKTIRYPGHLELIRFLLDDLRFKDAPRELAQILDRSVPHTRDDVVVVSIRALGRVAGRYEERTFSRTVPGRAIGAHAFTAIEVVTAAGVCGVLHLLLGGELPARGLVRMEQVPYVRFADTPFGRYYEQG
ncbi:MAG: saccharopine dehydrogenase family protein, partial [Planctomycetota bacterium]